MELKNIVMLFCLLEAILVLVDLEFFAVSYFVSVLTAKKKKQEKETERKGLLNAFQFTHFGNKLCKVTSHLFSHNKRFLHVLQVRNFGLLARLLRSSIFAQFRNHICVGRYF